MKNYKTLNQSLKLNHAELKIVRFISRKCMTLYKASIHDFDFIPTFKEGDMTRYTFSGKRIERGLYQRNKKELMNADLNGALNILRKSSVCGEEEMLALSRRGVNTPLRLQVM